MTLSVRGLALTSAIFWGGSILLVGLVALAAPGYGDAFLEICASIYPGYDHTGGSGDLLVGSLYGLVDGAVGGALFAWIYNRLSR